MQKQVSDFVDQHDLATGIEYRLLDLVSELGEVAKELLKATEYGHTNLQSDNLPDSWAEEMGDLLFSLICVANATGVNLECSLARVLSKYEKRLEFGKDAGSGR